MYNTTTDTLKPLPVPTDPSINYDVTISTDLVFNSTTGSNLIAKFNGNVTVNGTVNIYSYGTKTGSGSNISFGYSAKNHADLFYLNVSNNFSQIHLQYWFPTNFKILIFL